MSSFVIGTGYVGTELVKTLRDSDVHVTQSSRSAHCADVIVRDGSALDRELAARDYDQIVSVVQLTAPDVDWILERVDGPRWLILSSQQLASRVAAPMTVAAIARETVALERGASVLRPTMIFGRGGDRNVSRLIRFMQRWHVPVVPGNGDELVQPIHVADLIDLVARHAASPVGGLFPAGGPEALPTRELVSTLAELLGLRLRPIAVPRLALRAAAALAPLMGLRRDQLERLEEPKTVDWSRTGAVFCWEPAPLGVRLEEAVTDATQVSRSA